MGGAPSASAELVRQRIIGAKAAPAASELRLGTVYVSVARDGVPRGALPTSWASAGFIRCPRRGRLELGIVHLQTSIGYTGELATCFSSIFGTTATIASMSEPTEG